MANNKFSESDLLRLQGKGLKINDPVIDLKLKKAFGLPTKRVYSGKEKGYIEEVLMTLKNHNIFYEKEYKFHETRKYKFDFCIPLHKIYIEYEGIYSAKSGHTSMSGYSENCTKYNLATLCGWSALRYTSANYKNFGGDIYKFLGL